MSETTPSIHEKLDSLFPEETLTDTSRDETPSFIEITPITEEKADLERHRKAFLSGRLALVEEVISESCKTQELDIANLRNREKPALSILIGGVLADQIKTYKHKSEKSDTRFPILQVPGGTEFSVNQYYAETGNNLNSTDGHISRTSHAQLQGYVDIAKKYSQGFPEVELANSLKCKWDSSGLKAASESAEALVASYGMRLGDFARAQRIHVRVLHHPPQTAMTRLLDRVRHSPDEQDVKGKR